MLAVGAHPQPTHPRPCREILPLVCKRFREVLREPSMVREVRLGVASDLPWLGGAWQHAACRSLRQLPGAGLPLPSHHCLQTFCVS